jgi:hypothetical protein
VKNWRTPSPPLSASNFLILIPKQPESKDSGCFFDVDQQQNNNRREH